MIVRPSVTLVSPLDDLQAAIDATPEYGTLRLTSGVFTPQDANGFIISRAITIEGYGNPFIFEGIGPPKIPQTSGTVFTPYNAGTTAADAKNSTVIKIVGPVTNVVLRNFGIENPLGDPGAMGTGDGIRIDGTAGYIGLCLIEDVSILFMGRDGIHAEGISLGVSFDQSKITRTQIAGCYRHGIYFNYCTDIALDNVALTGNQQCGCYFYQSSNLHMFHCLFNENGKLFVRTGADWNGDAQSWPYYHEAQLYLHGCAVFTVIGCDFEIWAYSARLSGNLPVAHAIGLEGTRAGRISQCSTYNSDYVHDTVESVFIAILSNSYGITIEGNSCNAVDYYVYALQNNGNRGIVVTGSSFDQIVGAEAPCAVYLPANLDSDGSTASGGNFGLIPLVDASVPSGPTTYRFMAGVQLPVISDVAAFTSTKQDGTLSVEAAAKAMKIYQDGSWQTVLSGPVFYEDAMVVLDDEPVTY